MKKITPVGVRDYLPHEVKARQSIINKATAEFKSAGYEQVITPLFEYWSTIEAVCGNCLSEQAITFFNPKGELLVIRPDHTTAIARLAATRLREEKGPFQFYYSDAVYRLDPVNGETEHYQLGVENIGNPGVEEEAKLIQTCINTIKALGIQKFSIELNHTNELNQKSQAEQTALSKRDYTSLSTLPIRSPLSEINATHPLNELKTELTKLGITHNIYLNESIQTTTNDYDGMFFDCLIEGQGKPCGAGGRYDGLLIGFALDYNVISEALK